MADSLLMCQDANISPAPQSNAHCNNYALPSPLGILSSTRAKEKEAGVCIPTVSAPTDLPDSQFGGPLALLKSY